MSEDMCIIKLTRNSLLFTNCLREFIGQSVAIAQFCVTNHGDPRANGRGTILTDASSRIQNIVRSNINRDSQKLVAGLVTIPTVFLFPGYSTDAPTGIPSETPIRKWCHPNCRFNIHLNRYRTRLIRVYSSPSYHQFCSTLCSPEVFVVIVGLIPKVMTILILFSPFWCNVRAPP